MKRIIQNLKTTFSAYLIGTLLAVARLLSPRSRYALASRAGKIFSLGRGAMRRSLEENLDLLMPQIRQQNPRFHETVFQNFAITLLDFFMPDDLVVDVPDREKLDGWRRQHEGILMLTFHLGHWELGARVMQRWGWPVTAVYQPYSNRAYRRLIESHRAPGVHFIPVGGRAAIGVREALRKGDMVAMLGDHPFGEDGTDVHLLGHRVIWPKGPILLAVREKKPIVVAVVVRTSLGNYRAHIEEPLVPQASTRAEVDRLVQEVANRFGTYASRYPEQWYRFRPFEGVK